MGREGTVELLELSDHFRRPLYGSTGLTSTDLSIEMRRCFTSVRNTSRTDGPSVSVCVHREVIVREAQRSLSMQLELFQYQQPKGQALLWLL